MRILFLGGTGEISTACVRRAADQGHQVTVFNRGRRQEPLPRGVRHIVGDLADRAAVVELGKEHFDAVCQFLAFELDDARRDGEAFGGRCGQYVFISSASAYEKPPARVILTEDVPVRNPFWPYSQKKADIEAWLLQEHAAGRLPVTIVRPSHTHRTRFPGGIASGDEWAWRLRHGKPIIVHGDGTALWTLTHSEDFAVPFVGLLGKEAALGEAFHITRHMESHPWNRIYTACAQALGTEPAFVHVPTNTLVRYNPRWTGPLLGDKTWSVMFDNSKVMRVAGEWTCRLSLGDGLRRAAEHVKRRLEAHQPDPQTHRLLDRIAAEQQALGQHGPAGPDTLET